MCQKYIKDLYAPILWKKSVNYRKIKLVGIRFFSIFVANKLDSFSGLSSLPVLVFNELSGDRPFRIRKNLSENIKMDFRELFRNSIVFKSL